ncbi:hypothetical protein KIPB_014391, partial [Kipferlia bialata]|eukprot:g14391.t1
MPIDREATRLRLTRVRRPASRSAVARSARPQRGPKSAGSLRVRNPGHTEFRLYYD